MQLRNGVPKDGSVEARRYYELLTNAFIARREFLNQMLEKRRDIDKECQYPADPVPPYYYQKLYNRDPIAARVVQIYPKHTWKVHPWVYETEDTWVQTPFEKAWEELGLNLRFEKSKYQREQGHPIFEYLQRADILSGIGSYGVVLLGLNDGKPLSEPAEPKEGMKLVYLRVFSETSAPITAFESDPSNPRYGQPVKYSISFNTVTPSTYAVVSPAMRTTEVHWTRVVHFADTLEESEFFAIPRMQQVLNRLLDCRKLYAGSAEMYWQGAFPGISFETHPNADAEPDVALPEMKESIENYVNGLQRYLTLVGVSAKSLSPQVVDPTNQIHAQLEAICILIDVPKRIFMGSERGALASSQDESGWDDVIVSRQHNVASPRYVVPFVDRLVWLKLLPEPEQYHVWWPDITKQPAQTKADVAAKLVGTMVQYLSGNVNTLMAPLDFLTRVMGYEIAEAEAILDAAVEGQEDPVSELPAEEFEAVEEEEEEQDEEVDEESLPVANELQTTATEHFHTYMRMLEAL